MSTIQDQVLTHHSTSDDVARVVERYTRSISECATSFPASSSG